MKKFIILLVIMVLCLSGYEVRAQQQNQKTETKQELREERAQKRAARQLAFEQHVDSLVSGGYFQFIPRSMQRSVGPTLPISNPDFSLEYQKDRFDIYLPYIVGSMPPYRVSVINYVTSNAEQYTTQKTDKRLDRYICSHALRRFDLHLYLECLHQDRRSNLDCRTGFQHDGAVFGYHLPDIACC